MNCIHIQFDELFLYLLQVTFLNESLLFSFSQIAKNEMVFDS